MSLALAARRARIASAYETGISETRRDPLPIRPMFAAGLLNRMFPGASKVPEPPLGILLGCRRAVRYDRNLFFYRFVRPNVRLITFRNRRPTALMFL